MVNKQNLQPILFSILSGLLLIFSYPTFPYSFLAWIALVPLLLAIKGKPLWRTAQLGFITGFIYFYGILYWLNILYKFSWLILPGLILLSCYLALYIVGFVVVLNWLFPKPDSRRFLFIPFLWVSIEYFRQIGYLGFSWGILGYTQWQHLPLIQIADITSVLGISFLIALVNAGIVNLIDILKKKNKQDHLVLCPSSFVLFLCIPTLLILVLIYGQFRLVEARHTLPLYHSPIKVAVIQGNIPQEVKWDEQKEQDNQEIFFQLSEQAAQLHPELIVWPETAITEFLSANPKLIARFKDIANQEHTSFLVGSPDVEVIGENERFYTSAFFLNGEKGIIDKYDKMALVPFGEYIPLSGYLPLLKKYIQGPGDFHSGNRYTQFQFTTSSQNPMRFATVICFESTMSHHVRRFMKDQVDFLVVITNDAWFGKTEAPYQHAYMSVFRAIENRTDIVRAANTGYSCFIDSTGKINSGLEIYRRGYLIGETKPQNSRPFYTHFGDVFAYLCIIATIILIGLSRIPRYLQMQEVEKK